MPSLHYSIYVVTRHTPEINASNLQIFSTNAGAAIKSDCLYSSLFFEHYNRIVLCEWVIELCSVSLTDGVSFQNAFAFYLDSTSLGIGALLRSGVVTSVTC